MSAVEQCSNTKYNTIVRGSRDIRGLSMRLYIGDGSLTRANFRTRMP